MDRLDEVLRDFERRLSELEKKLGQKPAAAMGPAPGPGAANVPPRPAAPPRPRGPHPARPQAAPAPQAGTAGSFFGIVGIGFLLLAAVFFLKLTIDSGWLTPERQIFLAAAAGFGCLFLPRVLAELSDSYGGLLSGCGAAILHLTWLGAYQVHHLIDANQALLFATFVGTLAIFLNVGIGNAVFVIVAISGTYLAAPFLGYQTGDFSNLSRFFLVWNVTFSALGFLLRRRDVVLVAAYFAVLTVGWLSLSQHPLSAELARSLLVLQGLQFAIFSIANLLFSVSHGEPLGEDESWGACLLLLLFYGDAYFLLSFLAPELAPWMGVGLSLGVVIVQRLAASAMGSLLPSTPAIATFASVVLLHALYFKLTPDEYKPAVSLGLACVLAIAYGLQLDPFWKAPIRVAMCAVLFGAVLSFFSWPNAHLSLFYHFAYGVLALLIASFLSGRSESESQLAKLFLGFGHVKMMCGLYVVSFGVASGSLFVSLAWGAYAIAVLLWGFGRRDRVIGQSAVLILACVALKAAFYDVLLSTSLSRVLSLVAAGLVLYACGWIFRRMQDWPVARR